MPSISQFTKGFHLRPLLQYQGLWHLQGEMSSIYCLSVHYRWCQGEMLLSISLAIVPVQLNGEVTGVTDDRTFSNSYSVLKNKPIHYGTGTPSNSLGNNGDIYVQYES